MVQILDFFQYSFAFKALLVSSLVGVMCGVLGAFIVLRNMSMIGDALSHAILPGIVVAAMIVGYSTIGFFVGAVVAGLVAALAITWIQQNLRTRNDAAIGIVFTCMFAIGVVGISYISKNHSMHLDLKDFLFGNVLGISREDVYLTVFVAIYVLLSIVGLYRYLQASTFQPVVARTMGIPTRAIHYYLMLLMSLVVVSALRSVGVILVVAMLITPSSTALLLTNRLRWVLVLSGVLGACAAMLGLVLSVIWSSPPGPMMAIVATVFYALAGLFSPKYGILSRYWQRRTRKIAVLKEDILKESYKLAESGDPSLEALARKLDIARYKLRRLIRSMEKGDLISIKDDSIKLGAKGMTKSRQLVRAHRLWETYMVDKMGMSKEQIHNEAERIEHSLASEILEEIEQELGYPNHDPHGSLIPKDKNMPLGSLLLIDLSTGDFSELLSYEYDHFVLKKLWESGLRPKDRFEVRSVENGEYVLRFDNLDRELRIPFAVAQRLYVADCDRKS